MELGTHSGNSYAAFAQAIQMLELPCAAYAIDTWQGDSQAGFYDESVFAEWAAYHDRHFASFSSLIRSTFEQASRHFTDGSIDLLHLDGCHTYEAVSEDFRVWRPKLSRRAVVLLHDINVRERDFGAWRLWENLKAELPHFEFLHGYGLGVVGIGTDVSEPVRWLFSRQAADTDDIHAIRQFFARLGAAVSGPFAAGEVDRRAKTLLAQARDLTQTLDACTQARGALTDQLSELRQRLSDCGLRVRVLEEERKTDAAALAEADRELAAAHAKAEAQEKASSRRGLLARALQEQLVGEIKRRQQREAGRMQDRAVTPADRFGMELRRRSHSLIRRSPKWIRGSRGGARTMAALGLLPTKTRSVLRSGARFLRTPALLREAHFVYTSGLFDEEYYLTRYHDIRSSRVSALAHFILEGGREGRDPHPLFDGKYYLRSNPDVSVARANALIHYLTRGAFEGRSPHPLFDVRYYLSNNDDVRKASIEPLTHYLTSGAAEGRDPNPFFDTDYYLRRYPDVAARQINPLLHFVTDGWREGRRASARFDTAYYVSQYADVQQSGENPLAHFLEYGRAEGRSAVPPDEDDQGTLEESEALPELAFVPLKARSLLGGSSPWRPTVLCLSHVMPLPPRAGNEYRIYRMLRWLRDQGYRIVPVVAPLPGVRVDSDLVHALADEFSNAVLSWRDGRVEYILRDVPDVLGSLDGELTRPVSALLNEDAAGSDHARQLLAIDRTFCHDALIAATLRLQSVLGPHVLLCEYIWMSRILPLVSSAAVKIVDTIDVFSSKKEKVLSFGIEDLHVDPCEEAKRLQYADLVVAIQDDERHELERLLSKKRIVTAGVDFDVVADAGIPSGRRLLYVASDNPMNKKGLADFLRFAWIHVRSRVADAELLLAGRVCETLDADVPGVVRLGLVDDLAPLYRQARAVINPAVAGTGLKIKTLEALSHLRPLVTWPAGTDGLPPELKELCLTVHDWYEFSRRATGLLETDEPAQFSPAERDTVVRLTSAPANYGALTRVLTELQEQRFGAPRGSGVSHV